MAAAEVDAAFEEFTAVASGHGEDYVLDTGIDAGATQLGIGDGGVPEGEVVADGAGEEEDFLFDGGDRVTEDRSGDVLAGDAIKADFTRPGLIESGDDFGEGGFAGAGTADEGDALAGGEGAAKVFD